MTSLLFLLFLVLAIGIGIFTQVKSLRKENKGLVSEIKKVESEVKYLGIILIITTIFAMIFNIEDVIFGGSASVFGFLLSFGVVVIWGLFYRLILKNRKKDLIAFSTVIWSLTFLTALVTLYVNVTEVYINIVEEIIGFIMLLSVVLLTPLYGLGFVGESNHVITSIIILIISSVFIFPSLKYLIKNKK